MRTLGSLPLVPAVVPALLDRARAWPVDSQQVARRNAMIACTALAARRAEREDVEDFLAARGAQLRLEPVSRAEVAHG
jgi:hypothetical protein